MTESRKLACTICEGRKRCTSCGGTGIVQRIDVRMTCAVCNGGGKCLHCGGTGEIEGGGDPDIEAG